MAFACFGEDDDFGWEQDEGPPCSPVRAPVPVDLDMTEVNELERVRQARLLEVIESRRAEAKRIHALKRAAAVTAPDLDLPSTPGASLSSTSHVSASVDAPVVVSVASDLVTLPLVVDRATRVLRRRRSARSDDLVVDMPGVPKRRRISGKSGNDGPGCFFYKNTVTLPVEGTQEELSMGTPLPTSDYAAVSNNGVLGDSFITAALSDLSQDVLENKLINSVANRCLVRGGVVRHCRDLILQKIKAGVIAETSAGLSQGNRLQWGASQYLTMMSDQEKCSLYRCLIQDLRKEGKDEEFVFCYVTFIARNSRLLKMVIPEIGG